MRRSKPEVLDPPACKRCALDLLARREHSRLELQRKLASREFPDDVIEPVLDQLERDGVLAAARFTGSFVRVRVARGQGPVRIRGDLKQRGIEAGLATEALQSGDVDWVAAARSVRTKRFGPDAPRDYKERARQARFLQYRGFETRHIQAALEVDEDSD